MIDSLYTVTLYAAILFISLNPLSSFHLLWYTLRCLCFPINTKCLTYLFYDLSSFSEKTGEGGMKYGYFCVSPAGDSVEENFQKSRHGNFNRVTTNRV